MACPVGVSREGVVVPSPTGLRLVTRTTGGEREGPAAWAGAVGAGAYMGTEEIGLPMAGGGDTRGGGAI